jgi:hypothetical protein
MANRTKSNKQETTLDPDSEGGFQDSQIIQKT